MCILAITTHTHTHTHTHNTRDPLFPIVARDVFARKEETECERGHFALIQCWTLRTLPPYQRN